VAKVQLKLPRAMLVRLMNLHYIDLFAGRRRR